MNGDPAALERRARDICARQCRGMGVTDKAHIQAWVDANWRDTAAEIEAGVIDDEGNAAGLNLRGSTRG